MKMYMFTCTGLNAIDIIFFLNLKIISNIFKMFYQRIYFKTCFFILKKLIKMIFSLKSYL